MIFWQLYIILYIGKMMYKYICYNFAYSLFYLVET